MFNMYRTVSKDKKLSRLKDKPKGNYYLLLSSFQGNKCVSICPTSISHFLRLNKLFIDNPVRTVEVRIEAEIILRSLKCRFNYEDMKDFIDDCMGRRHGYELVTEAEMIDKVTSSVGPDRSFQVTFR
jgi:hypothetical protein